MTAPLIRQHGGFLVVRDDMVPGGTKARVAHLLFGAATEYVYASPVYGYAQIALAHAGRRCGKRVTIFCARRRSLHPRTVEAAGVGANIEQVPTGYLAVVQARAREYCTRTGAEMIPFGFDVPAIRQAMTDVARSIPVEPAEVWSVAGSGMLSKALQAAWPAASFHAVRVGRDPDVGSARLHVAAEKFEQDARHKPPFPSCSNYDAKAWAFMLAYAKPGALFWNVAA